MVDHRCNSGDFFSCKWILITCMTFASSAVGHDLGINTLHAFSLQRNINLHRLRLEPHITNSWHALGSYASLHNRILSGEEPLRLLIWNQADGRFDGTHGIGNEMLTFQSILLLAFLMKRAVLFNTVKPWWEFARSPYICWDYKTAAAKHAHIAELESSIYGWSQDSVEGGKPYQGGRRVRDLSDFRLQRDNFDEYFSDEIEVLNMYDSMKVMEIMPIVEMMYALPQYWEAISGIADEAFVMRGIFSHFLFGDYSDSLLDLFWDIHREILSQIGPADGMGRTPMRLLAVHFNTGLNEQKFVEHRTEQCKTVYVPTCDCLTDMQAPRRSWPNRDDSYECYTNTWNALAAVHKQSNFFLATHIVPFCLERFMGVVSASSQKIPPGDHAEMFWVVLIMSNDLEAEAAILDKLNLQFPERNDVKFVRMAKRNNPVNKSGFGKALADNLYLSFVDYVFQGSQDSTFAEVGGQHAIRRKSFEEGTKDYPGLDASSFGTPLVQVFKTCESWMDADEQDIFRKIVAVEQDSGPFYYY